MKLKIPPALQFLFFAMIMWGIYKLTATKHLVFEHQKLVSRLLFFVGIIIGVSAVYSFKKARTTADPLHPDKASHLVTTGIYNYSRNPMYLAMLFVLIALFIRLGNLYSIVVLPGYVWYMTTYQIKPEEEVLTRLFRNKYLEYCQNVRRWI